MDDLIKLIHEMPLPAVMVFAGVLAVGLLLRQFGIAHGKRTGPDSSNSAQVLSVIVDSSAVARLTEKVGDLTEAIQDIQKEMEIHREIARARR